MAALSRSSEYSPLSDIIDLIMTGDCDTDDDCEGSLMCGKNNCKGDFFNNDDDCCTDIPPPTCDNETKCFDADLDPKGEKYDGCTNTTVSGRTCQVELLFR